MMFAIQKNNQVESTISKSGVGISVKELELSSNAETKNDFLQIKYIYGIDLLFPSKILHFKDKMSLIYLAGFNLLTINIETLKLKTIPMKCKNRVELITLSPDFKYAFLVEVENKTSNIIIIDLEKNYEIKSQKTIQNGIINSLTISKDIEYIICQTLGPDWNLMIFSFNLDKLTLVSQIKSISSEAASTKGQTVEEVSFFPNENKRILLIGNKLLKVYQFSKSESGSNQVGKIKLIFNFPTELYFMKHDWINKNEIICVDRNGGLYLIEPKLGLLRSITLRSKSSMGSSIIEEENEITNNLKKVNSNSSSHVPVNKHTNLLSISELTLDRTSLIAESINESFISFNQNYKNQRRMTNYSIGTNSGVQNRTHLSKASLSSISIICFKKGFFYSNSSDKIFYYEKMLNKLTFNLLYTIKIKPNIKIVDKKRSSQSILSMSLNGDSSILAIVTDRKNIYYCDLKELFSTEGSNTDFETVIESIHSEFIIDIDTCIKKPFVATCSTDRWVNIWNYDTHLFELRQNFDEDLFSVALHPSGLYIIVCTGNSLKFMTIYSDQLKTTHVLNVRNCTHCTFSNGGHMFAFIYGTVVQIYSTMKFTEIGSIKAQNLGKIKELIFTQNDQYLFCCSMAGIIEIWEARTQIVVNKVITQGLSYTNMAIHPNQEFIFLTSTEKTLRQYQLPTYEEHKYLIRSDVDLKLVKKSETVTNENATCVAINKSGTIVCIGTNKGTIQVFILNNNTTKTFKAHTNPITKICFSSFDKYLITTSDNGTIVYWVLNSELISSYQTTNVWNEEILIDKNEYFNKCEAMLSYEKEIKHCTIDTKFKLELKNLRFNVKLREIKNRFVMQMGQLKNEVEQLNQGEELGCFEFEKNFRNLTSDYLEKTAKLNNETRLKISIECEKTNCLKKENDTIVNSMKSNKEEASAILLKQESEQYESVESELRATSELNNSKLSQYESQIETLKKYELSIEKEVQDEMNIINRRFKEEIFKLEDENRTFERSLAKLNSDLKYQEDHFREIAAKTYSADVNMIELIKTNKDLEKSEKSLAGTINEKNVALIERQKRIDLLNIDCDLYLASNSQNQLMTSKLSKKVDPIEKSIDSQMKHIDEVRLEIKEKKLEINKMKSMVSGVKNISHSKVKEIRSIKANINKVNALSEQFLLNIYDAYDKNFKSKPGRQMIKKKPKFNLKSINYQRSILENLISKLQKR